MCANAGGRRQSPPGNRVKEQMPVGDALLLCIFFGARANARERIFLFDIPHQSEERAIVIHAASYVNEVQAKAAGKIGRSEGCFAVTGDSLEPVLSHLGTGRFLYAEKIGSAPPKVETRGLKARNFP